MRRVPVLVEVVVGLGFVAALVGWVLQMHLDVPADRALAVAFAAASVAGLVNVILHEGGHALAAVILGLRVHGIRVFGIQVMGRPGSLGPNHVLFDAGTRPARKARVVAATLAGPAVNLAIAAAALPTATDPGVAWTTRAGAAGVVMSGAYLGVESLIPMSAKGRSSDGYKVLRWLVGGWSIAVPDSIYPVGGRSQGAATPDHRTDVAGSALARQLVHSTLTIGAEAAVWRHYPELLGLVARPDCPVRLTRSLAGAPGMTVCVGVLHRLVSGRARPDPSELERIVVLLDAGLAHSPDDVITRSALGLALLLLDRDEEARRTLLQLDTTGSAPGDAATAYAVRAQAEAACGNFGQAGRLVRAAHELAPRDALVRFSVALVERARARSDAAAVGDAETARQTPSA